MNFQHLRWLIGGTFQAELDALRDREKAHTKEGNAIEAARRRLPMVEVDGATIQRQQVILNLLRNGSEAMSTVDDRPRELLFRTERDGEDRVRLSVKMRESGLHLRPRTRCLKLSTRRNPTA
jgi:C4-dicarboxylate-specific signal transduction histidine kinase